MLNSNTMHILCFSYQEVYKGQSYACKINRLSEMTTYRFRIQASNDAGSGSYSDTYTCLTTKAPPPALKGINKFCNIQ